MKFYHLILVGLSLVVLAACQKQVAVERHVPPTPTPDIQKVKLQNFEWVKLKEEVTAAGMKKILYVQAGSQSNFREVLEDQAGKIVKETLNTKGFPRFISEYDPHGALKSEVKFEYFGQSKSVLYFPNGQRKEEWNSTKAGQKTSQTWNEAGQLLQEDQLDKNGKYISAKRWYDNGTLKYEAMFANGEPLMRIWYKPDGSIEKRVRGKRG